MPMERDELDEMRALIGVARKRDLSFGLCLGKKPEDSVLYMHRMKAPEILARQAKKAGDTPKVTSGTVSVKGKVMSLTCQDEIPAGMARSMRLFLSRNDMKMKVQILDPSGELLDSDGDEDQDEDADAADAANEPQEAAADRQSDGQDQDAAEEAAAAETATDPLAREWQDAERDLSQPVAAFVGSGHEKAGVVEKAWAGALQAAGKGDYKSALIVAQKIRPLVDGSAGESAAQATTQSPEAAEWARVEGPMSDLFTSAVAKNPPTRSKIEAAWAMAVEKAQAGDYKAALTIAERLRPALEAVVNAAPAETEVPKDVVAFQKSRVLWSGTRTKMKAEMKKLESAIASICAADPELAPIATEVGELSKRLDVFDEQLEDILDRITNTPEGAARDALKNEAKTAISRYQDALDDQFFSEVDSDNGFVNVSVTSTAQKSLEAISKTLGA